MARETYTAAEIFKNFSDVERADCPCRHRDCQRIIKRRSVSTCHQGAGFTRGLYNNTWSTIFKKVSPSGKRKAYNPNHFGKVKEIFFSPHPDDIAYSCFGLASNSSKRMAMHRSSSMYSHVDESYQKSIDESNRCDDSLRSSIKTTSSSTSSISRSIPSFPEIHYNQPQEQSNWIITVFSKSRCANGSIGQALRHCVHATTELRQREDEEFARSIDAKLFSLDLKDTSARDEISRQLDLMNNAPYAIAHPCFKAVKEKVRPFVEWAVKCQATIHIPVAIGCHIDHWMVRVAVLSVMHEIEERKHVLQRVYQGSIKSGLRLVFYEDLPYTCQTGDQIVQQIISDFLPRDVRVQLIPLTEDDWIRKKAAVEGYASQLKPDLVVLLNNHALYLGKKLLALNKSMSNDLKSWVRAERSWVIDGVYGSSERLLRASQRNVPFHSIF